METILSLWPFHFEEVWIPKTEKPWYFAILYRKTLILCYFIPKNSCVFRRKITASRREGDSDIRDKSAVINILQQNVTFFLFSIHFLATRMPGYHNLYNSAYETTLGQFRENFETNWDNFELNLGHFWYNFETILRQLWGKFGTILR